MNEDKLIIDAYAIKRVVCFEAMGVSQRAQNAFS